jgi:hypothetical protein
MKRATCTRCNGTGNLKGFSHVRGGICFRCEGSGKEPRTAAQALPTGNFLSIYRKNDKFVFATRYVTNAMFIFRFNGSETVLISHRVGAIDMIAHVVKVGFNFTQRVAAQGDDNLNTLNDILAQEQAEIIHERLTRIRAYLHKRGVIVN